MLFTAQPGMQISSLCQQELLHPPRRTPAAMLALSKRCSPGSSAMCEDFTWSMLRKQACNSSDADARQEVQQPTLGNI